MSDIAVCQKDDEPLIWTFEFPGVTTYACSRVCISKADESSGKRSLVMPW